MIIIFGIIVTLVFSFIGGHIEEVKPTVIEKFDDLKWYHWGILVGLMMVIIGAIMIIISFFQVPVKQSYYEEVLTLVKRGII